MKSYRQLISELNNSTLTSYVNKAVDDLDVASYHDDLRSERRKAGIKLAIKKKDRELGRVAAAAVRFRSRNKQ